MIPISISILNVSVRFKAMNKHVDLFIIHRIGHHQNVKVFALFSMLELVLKSKTNLVTRERTSTLSAHHICLVELEAATILKDLSWPVMVPDDSVVFQELK